MKKNAPYELPEDFSKRIGLTFKDGLLLYHALTHRSFLNEHADAIEDNQRLEFLGDAVLGFVVGAWLYNAGRKGNIFPSKVDIEDRKSVV